MSKKIICLLILFLVIFKVNVIVKAVPSEDNSESTTESSDGTLEDAEVCSGDSTKKSVKFKDKEYCYGKNEGVYCTKNDTSGGVLPGCFIVNKNTKTYYDDLQIYGFPIFEYTFHNQRGDAVGTVTATFLTSSEDPIANSDNLWWSSTELCYTWEPHFFTKFKVSMFAYTDSLVAIIGDNSWFNESKCSTYEVINVEPENKVAFCSKINERENNIATLAAKYKADPKPSLINKYKILVSEIEDMCTIVLQNQDYNESCVSKCLKLSESIKKWDDKFNTSTGGTKCGFSMRLISWVINIIKWIKYIIPVLVIILGILDFIKATSSDKDDEMKKAQGNFVKRLIAAALIFLVPLLVEFILPKLGFDYYSCGIF